ncbi:hypothetical protein E1265_18180 [Streptomyces sp. 8K308]|uniref:hypothetical protein n=1 Tax=Streptomyces sp. 8K308 TaxID=2530388 RepID=UPI00104F28A4|nr:hypothetical protein [Streptomyces sp. 8K308]TDC21370.1 hypothetical protein E1265_18180 [Streptomyces sp. 8K308]
MSATRTASHLLKSALTGRGTLTRAAVAAAIVGTVAAQHHHVAVFNRPRRLDRFSLLPSWRFFAPLPGTHDYYAIYRTVDHAHRPSRWHGLDLIAGRSPGQLLWFPARRGEKAVFDITVELQLVLDRGFPTITRTPAYRLLEAHITDRIRAEDRTGEVAGYQIALAKAAGYDTREEPSLIMVTPYTPLAAPPTAPRPPAVEA